MDLERLYKSYECIYEDYEKGRKDKYCKQSYQYRSYEDYVDYKWEDIKREYRLEENQKSYHEINARFIKQTIEYNRKQIRDAYLVCLCYGIIPLIILFFLFS